MSGQESQGHRNGLGRGGGRIHHLEAHTSPWGTYITLGHAHTHTHTLTQTHGQHVVAESVHYLITRSLPLWAGLAVEQAGCKCHGERCQKVLLQRHDTAEYI